MFLSSICEKCEIQKRVEVIINYMAYKSKSHYDFNIKNCRLKEIRDEFCNVENCKYALEHIVIEDFIYKKVFNK